MKAVLIAAVAVGHAAAGGHTHFMGPLNPALGTHGFPDCVQPGPFGDDVEANQMSMRCFQRGGASTIKIGCVGDSITAGAHS